MRPPLQIDYQGGATHSGQIPGRRYHLGANYSGGIAPSISNTRRRIPSSRRIPGRCYPIQTRYQYGAIPSISNTRAVLSSKSEIPGKGYPPRSNTRDRMPPTCQILERCYPLEAKYLDGDISVRLNTSTGPTPSDQTQGRCPLLCSMRAIYISQIHTY